MALYQHVCVTWSDNMSVLSCRQRGGCDSVTWRCLHPLSWVLVNLEIQRFNTSTTGRRRRQKLTGPTWHCRLRANISCVCRWRWVYLANVGRRRRHHAALAAKVTAWNVRTIHTVSDINSPARDVRLRQTTDAVRRRWQWTETCSSAGQPGTRSRRGVTDWNIYRQSPQRSAVVPVAGQWSQHRRRGAASVHRFTSIITLLACTHRCWLSRKRCLSGQRQSYFAARRSLDATSSYHRWTSAQIQDAAASVLQRTVRTTVGWVQRGQERVSVWCCSLAQLHITPFMQFVLRQCSTLMSSVTHCLPEIPEPNSV